MFIALKILDILKQLNNLGRDHCQRSSPSRISDTPRAAFEPAQNLSSGFVEWSCAVVITTTPGRHYIFRIGELQFSLNACEKWPWNKLHGKRLNKYFGIYLIIRKINTSTLAKIKIIFLPRVILLFVNAQNYFSFLLLSFANGSCECVDSLLAVNNKDTAKLKVSVFIFASKRYLSPGSCITDPSNDNCWKRFDPKINNDLIFAKNESFCKRFMFRVIYWGTATFVSGLSRTFLKQRNL